MYNINGLSLRKSFLVGLILALTLGVAIFTSLRVANAEEEILPEVTTTIENEVTVPTETEISVEPTVTEEAVVEETVDAVVPETTPALSTDKDDYHPTETATIFGKFFKSLESVVLKVFGSDEKDGNYTESTETLTTDDSGSFTSKYTLDDIYRPFYLMEAYDLSGSLLAKGFFRDAAVGLYDQCSNDDGDGYDGNPGNCGWTNGNLNGSNSTYQEGDSTVQRLWMEGFAPGSSHTVTFQYGTTKAGKRAYDFLTSWDASENWVTVADRCDGITGCTSGSDATFAIPHDPNGSGQFETGTRNFTIRGGTITNVSVPSLVSGTYAGDSETSITVSFTAANSGSMCSTKGQVTSCGIALWFGAHVAKSSEWTPFDGTTGAGSISGAPYHVSLESLDGGSVGQRDNQMQANSIILASTITVHKVTAPNASDPTSFNFSTTGTGYSNFSLTGGNLNSQNIIGTGSFSVTETVPSGWANTALTCTAQGTGSSATPNLGNHSVAITIGSGGGATIDCTYTNTLQQAHLTLVKTVTNDNGGTAAITDWTLSANGPTSISGTSGNASVTNAAVNAGAYALSESSGPAGYTAGSWSCVGGTQNGSSVTLAPGASATCTINNNDNAPSLTLNKIVVNDNGGTALESDWTLSATGPTSISGPGAAGSADVVSGPSFDAGAYALSESSGPAGYSASAWSCVGGTQNGSNITLGLGQSATCTITNNDIAPTLKLVKTVINDNGGTAVENDFQGKINGGNVPWNVAQTETAGSYTASETNLPGYTAGSWGGDCAANGSVTLGVGENKTCTITNDDQQAFITVVKVVINDNGGTAQPNDFALKLEGNATTSGTQVAVNPGTYTASETLVNGYSFVGFTGDCDSNGDTTVALGESKTCTLTNNDIQPTLTLIKHVINDNGGTKVVSDFPLFVNATGVTSGVANGFNAGSYTASETNQTGYSASSWSGDCDANGAVTLGVGDNKTCEITNNDISPTLKIVKTVINDNGGTAVETDFQGKINGGNVPWNVAQNVNAGSNTASETTLPTYTASSWGGDCAADGSVTLALAENKTCTITNDDIAPSLHLRKIVVNDNGGTATTADFTLTANGAGANDISGATPVDSDGTLKADTFALSETNVAGYSASAWSCVGGTQNGANITLGLGQSATCTITNDDISPTLTLVKTVINDNGGTAVANDFQGKIDNANVPWQVAQNVNAGAHTATETVVTDYTAGSWGGDCAADGSVTLALGENKTCTITNNDNAPSLTLNKIVVNDNGGTALESDWTLSATGPTSISGPGAAGSADVVSGPSFDAGAYALSESGGPSGYSASAWSCVGGTQNGSNITLGLGQSATCTITNDDVQPKLTLIKHVINDNGGTKVVSDFPLFVNATGVTSGVANGFNAGSYTASETNQTGYTASAWSGDCAANGTVTLNVGDNKTCEITNDDQPATLIIVKDAQPNDLIDFNFTRSFGANFSLDDDAGVNGEDNVLSNTATFNNLSANTNLTVAETLPNSFWKLNGIACVETGTQTSYPFTSVTNGMTVNLGLGKSVTCTFTNVKESPTRTQGFWQTHTAYTSSTFATFFPAGMTIGTAPHKGVITNVQSAGQSQLFGAYYSNIAKTTTGSQRTAIDKARMQLLQQLVTAKLNCAAFGCSASIQTMIANADTAYATGTAAQIIAAAGALDAYNNSGDTFTIGNAGKATPKTSQDYANKVFWNLP